MVYPATEIDGVLIWKLTCRRRSGWISTGRGTTLDELDIGVFDIFKVVVGGHFSVVIKIYEDKIGIVPRLVVPYP